MTYLNRTDSRNSGGSGDKNPAHGNVKSGKPRRVLRVQMQSRTQRALFEAHFKEQQGPACTCLRPISVVDCFSRISLAVASTHVSRISGQCSIGPLEAIRAPSHLWPAHISRVRFQGDRDLEICRIAGDIALIHDLSTSSPLRLIRSSTQHRGNEHI